MSRSLVSCCLVLVLVGCGKGSADESGSPTGSATGNPTTGPGGGNPGGTVSTAGWNLTGTAIDFAAQAPAAEGLCIELLDPSPALTGGEPLLLVSSTIGAAGAIDLTGIKTTSVLGLLASVKDCGTENQTVFTSATGVPYEDIRYMSEGETLPDVTALVISMPFLAGMQASLELLGYSGDLATDGLIFGVLRDNAGAPISGGTVTCATCGPTYYLDATDVDGLFGVATVANTTTSAAAGGVWVVPAGPVGQYQAEDGGAHAFPVQLNGSTPGSAVVTAIYAY